MKILLITAAIGEKSGWGRYSEAVLKGLVKRGVYVEVITQSYKSDFSVPVHFIRALPRKFAALSVLVNIYRVRRLAKGFDVVHALDVWPYGIYAYFAVLGRNIKLFMNGVGTYSVAPLHRTMTSWISRKACRHSEKIFCISKYTEKLMVDSGIPRDIVTTVHMGTSALPRLSSNQVKDFKHKYQKIGDRKLILTVGAIKDRKGQLDTLKAIGVLRKHYPDIMYVMIGSADDVAYVSSIKTYAEENDLTNNIFIISKVDDYTLSYFYSICSVFALNSKTDLVNYHFEGFGLVIIEACQFGVPSVGSRDCGIEDAIKDGTTGLLAKQGSPDDIAEKIRKVLDKRDFFSKNALSWYTEFDWDMTVSAYISEYENTYIG